MLVLVNIFRRQWGQKHREEKTANKICLIKLVISMGNLSLIPWGTSGTSGEHPPRPRDRPGEQVQQLSVISD